MKNANFSFLCITEYDARRCDASKDEINYQGEFKKHNHTAAAWLRK